MLRWAHPYVHIGVVAACIQCITSNVLPQEIARLNFFDTDLLRYAAEDRKGNVMVSPASIKSTLSMILEAASGDTEAEIKSALRLSPYRDELREQLNLYLASLNSNSPGVKLQNSNSLFVSKRLRPRKEFEQIIRNVYFADVSLVDFTDSLAAADTVNKWVNQHTKGLIPRIVEPSEINPVSDALISNALYFKGRWSHAFNPKYTRPGCFHVDNVCQNAVMMELHDDMNYGFVDNLRAHAIELPYEGKRYSMILLVPLEKGNLNTLIRDLPYMSLPQISQLMESTNVRLFMPKFTVDYSTSMVEPLRNMKITTLFTKNATLPGMFESGSPQVNDILHKVYMSVDEVGTVAAAATSAMVIPLIEDGVQLKVDRPFLFFIRDNELGLILFAGKIEEPLVNVEDKVSAGPPRPKYQPMPPQRNWYR